MSLQKIRKQISKTIERFVYFAEDTKKIKRIRNECQNITDNNRR